MDIGILKMALQSKHLISGVFFLFALSCMRNTHEQFDNTNHKINQYLKEALRVKDHHADSALVLAHNAFILSKETGSEIYTASSACLLAELSMEKGQYKKASAYLVESIVIFENAGNPVDLGKAYNLQGRIYQHNNRFNQAAEYFFNALHQFESAGNLTGIGQSYSQLGHLFEKTENVDSAFYYNEMALSIFQTLGDSLGLAVVFDNIGSIHEDIQQFEDARRNFEKAYLINKIKLNEIDALINLNNVADTYRKTHNHDRAQQLYFTVLEASKKLDQPYQTKSAYRDLSRSFFLSGEYEKGYLYLDSCYQLTDQIAREEIARGIEDSQALYELEQKQRELTLLEEKRRLTLISRNILIALILLMVVLAIQIYSQLKSKIRNNRKLYDAEKKLSELKQNQLESELRLKKFYEDKIREELESMSKELTTNTLNIIKKNKLLGNLKVELNELKSSGKTIAEKDLRRIIRTINHTIKEDEDWREFENIFQQVHKSFFEELSKRYPNLSNAELRLCAMIKLNVSSKEMSNILGISADSLRIARYRLRKKLQIEKGSNLYSHIMTIC